MLARLLTRNPLAPLLGVVLRRGGLFALIGLLLLVGGASLGSGLLTTQAEGPPGLAIGEDAAAFQGDASQALPLGGNDFTLSAPQGFGDRQNSVMWSMKWWDGNLYVGTNRAWLCWSYAGTVATFPVLSYLYPPQDPDIECEADYNDLPLQAEIWRWTPLTNSWDRVYQSPQDVPIPGVPGKFVARSIAFRSMAVHTDPDGTEALYVAGTTSQPIHKDVPPPRILRTTDGVNFAPVPQDPGTFMGDLSKASFRSLTSFNGRLYVIHGSVQGNGVILESADPAAGNDAWRQVSPEGLRFFELQEFNGSLYAGSVDVEGGYSVLKMVDTGAPPYTFVPIVSDGGYASEPSRAVVSMEVFQGALYVGMDKPSELIRIQPDGSWDLIIGTPRMTPTGPKAPLGGLDWGYNYGLNRHLWRMQSHDGVLYVGTYDQSTSQRLCPEKEELVGPYAGFDLYRSTDGVHFSAVTIDGFGDQFDVGVRNFESTPYGLFMGTANLHFGGKVYRAVPTPPGSGRLDPPGPALALSHPDGAVLTWGQPAGATRFRIFRSPLTTMMLNIPGGVLPPFMGRDGCDPTFTSEDLTPELTDMIDELIAQVDSADFPADDLPADPWSLIQALIGARDSGDSFLLQPRGVEVPMPATEIAAVDRGAGSNGSFLDTGIEPGVRYSYYILAEDDQGNMSGKSNLVTFPLPGGTPPLPVCGPGPDEPDGTALDCVFTNTIDDGVAPGDDDCVPGEPCSIAASACIAETGAPCPPTPAGDPGGTPLAPTVTMFSPAAFTFAPDLGVTNGASVGSVAVDIRSDLGLLPTCSADLELGPGTLVDGGIQGNVPDDAGAAALFDPTLWPTRLAGPRAAIEAAFPGIVLWSRGVTSYDVNSDGAPDVPLNVLHWNAGPGGWVTFFIMGDPTSPAGSIGFCTPFLTDATFDAVAGDGADYRVCDIAGPNDFAASIDPRAGVPGDDGFRVDPSTCSVPPVPGEIDGIKVIDLDADGNLEAEDVCTTNDPGCAGVTIFLDLDANGSLDGGEPTTTTDADGAFSFADVMPGDYIVCEVVPGGFQASTPTCTGPHALAGGQVLDLGKVFGNYATTEIDGVKVIDLDADGNLEAEDVCDAADTENHPGCAGVTIFLDLNVDGLLNGAEPTTLTDAVGAFSFVDLAPGDYTVCELIPGGFQVSAGPCSGPHSLASGEALDLGKVFGNYSTPGIHGTKVIDLDTDGNLEAEDVCDAADTENHPGCSGVTIFLDLDVNGSLDGGEPTATTDAAGAFSFADLAPGDYTVCEVVPAGFQASTDLCSGPHTLASGEALNLGKVFGNFTNAGIDGIKVIDLDADGNLEAEDVCDAADAENHPGCSGVTIFLDLNVNGSLDGGEPTTTTDADGAFSFADLAPGDYTVCEVVPADFQASTDLCSGPHTLVSGEALDLGKVFGNSPTTVASITATPTPTPQALDVETGPTGLPVSGGVPPSADSPPWTGLLAGATLMVVAVLGMAALLRRYA